MPEQEDLSTGSAGSPEPGSSELVLLRAVTRRDQRELDSLRRQLLAMTDAADLARRRLTETERRLEQARASIDVLEHSFSFRFGNALVTSVRSPRQLLRLPRTLWQMVRDRRRGAPEPRLEGLASRSAPAAPLGDLPPEPTMGYDGFLRKPATAPRLLAELRVAAIMDGFTHACFMPTCRMQSLHAQHYEQQLLDDPPDLLLVESAWRGEADSWRNMIASRSGELLGLLDMCRRRNIPTVFWNKEDPAHFATFLETARLFDHVFTTDIDSIRRYVAALEHTRVHLLPFACQPRVHNPVVPAARREGVSFAGSYYHRYPERCDDFDRLISTLAEVGPVVIYDRNSERADPAFAFPRRFASMLQPALPYERIDEAYKGHRFAVNMNTIKQSQSMFARRVFELMACNTVVVSNYSRGMRNFFGELAVSTDQADVLGQRVQPMMAAPERTRRHRLLALRKVLSEHTYEHRMRQLAQVVLERAPSIDGVPMVVVARVNSAHELEQVLGAYQRQVHALRELIIVAAAGLSMEAAPARRDCRVLRETDAAGFALSSLGSKACVAVFHPADYYGPHYLADLALATLFSDAPMIGKGALFRSTDERVALIEGPRYQPDRPLLRRSSMARGAALEGASLLEWLDAAALDDGEPRCAGLSVDEFSYCRDGALIAGVPIFVDVDGRGMDLGIDYQQMLDRAEALRRLPPRPPQPLREDAAEVNARPADFAGCIARSDQLIVAEDVAQLEWLVAGSGADVFLCGTDTTRSFSEWGPLQLLHGGVGDLRDLLEQNTYGELRVQAPGAGLCEVLAEHAPVRRVKIQPRSSDLRAADGSTGWVKLLSRRLPRVTVALATQSDAQRLWSILGAELDPCQWQIGVDATSPRPAAGGNRLGVEPGHV